MSRLTWSRRKSVVAVFVCTILVGSFFGFWQMNQSAQASMIYPQVDVPSGLVGWWRFNEGSGVVANDSSGFGNNGAIYGATWVDGKYAKALSFDSTSSYVLVPHDSSLSSSTISVGAWIKRDRTGVDEMVISKYGGDYKEFYLFVNSGDKLCFLIGDGADTVIAYSTMLLDQTDVWYFIAGTYDGTYLHVFIDGEDKTSGSPAQDSISHNTGPVVIGKASWYDAQYFDGIIDCSVELSYQKDNKTSEISLTVHGNILKASETSEDFKKSITLAVEKLEPQVKKYKQKKRKKV